MKRTIHITGKIEPFFGTLDENIRSLEDYLRVRTHLHDTRLTVEGEQEGVDQAVRIVEEYNHLTRHGRELSSAEVKSSAARGRRKSRTNRRGGCLSTGGRVRSERKWLRRRPQTQRKYMEEIESHDMTFGIGPGGTGKTYLGRGDGGERAADETDEPDYFGAAGGGGGGAIGISTGDAAAEN